jgi:hypothetical protein
VPVLPGPDDLLQPTFSRATSLVGLDDEALAIRVFLASLTALGIRV